MNGGARFAAITTVTFDAGGTLLRPHPSVGVVYREVALRHGCDRAADVLDRTFRAAFGCVSKSSLPLDPEAREREFWRRVALATFTDAGPPPADFNACFAELWEVFAQGDRWRLLPGALTTVQTLRARGYRLAVLSNWDRRLHRVLEETGLRPWFDAVLISSEVGAEKPDAGIFRAAERALDAAPAQCLHIGDSHLHDLVGARAAGWSALLVGRNDADRGTTEMINDLSGLLAHLPGPDPGLR